MAEDSNRRCAENGEFHTLAVAGPMFHDRLDVDVGDVVDRERFVFVEVTLRDSQAAGRRGEESRGEREHDGSA